MKKALAILLCCISTCMLTACRSTEVISVMQDEIKQGIEEALLEIEPKNVWTITIDDDCVAESMGVIISAQCHAVLSTVAGKEPIGSYSGGITMDFSVDSGRIGELLTSLGEKDLDFSATASNSALAMELIPYERQAMMDFVNSTRDELSVLEPLIDGKAMCFGDSIDLPEGDIDMLVDFRTGGFLNDAATGDKQSAVTDAQGMPYSLLLLPDGRVQLTIYSGEGIAGDLIFYGVMDCVSA
ncbi:MAG: hypothetical protein RR232_06795 [Clostridia bacterium]